MLSISHAEIFSPLTLTESLTRPKKNKLPFLLDVNECIIENQPVLKNPKMKSIQMMVYSYFLINGICNSDSSTEELEMINARNKLKVYDGPEIKCDIKERYKTGWEIKQKHIIDMSADRGKFICQSQSLNLFMEAPNFSKLSSMHFYAWKKGLKTGMYYLRSRPSSKAIQFTVSPEICENCSA